MGTIALSIWNYPQYFAILHNLIHRQSIASKARMNNPDRLGVKTFLIKPYDGKTLLKTVAQALSHSRDKSAS